MPHASGTNESFKSISRAYLLPSSLALLCLVASFSATTVDLISYYFGETLRASLMSDTRPLSVPLETGGTEWAYRVPAVWKDQQTANQSNWHKNHEE